MPQSVIRRPNLLPVGVVSLAWFAITAATPYLNRLYDVHAVNPWILPYVRMTLMLLVTWLYIRWGEQLSAAEGFGLQWDRIGRALAWGVVFALLASAAVYLYEAGVVNRLMPAPMEASSALDGHSVEPLTRRVFEYGYIVYEGIVEVLIFVGFLADRLARRWGWTAAVVVSNVVFAAWHYNYLRAGVLPGTLMILLSFIAGVIITLGYVRTRNTLTPTVSHFLVDSPEAVRILLGWL